MIKQDWCFWILLIAFIFNFISIFLYAGGLNRKTTWNATLTERLIFIMVSVVFLIIYAIALGWL